MSFLLEKIKEGWCPYNKYQTSTTTNRDLIEVKKIKKLRPRDYCKQLNNRLVHKRTWIISGNKFWDTKYEGFNLNRDLDVIKNFV